MRGLHHCDMRQHLRLERERQRQSPGAGAGDISERLSAAKSSPCVAEVEVVRGEGSFRLPDAAVGSDKVISLQSTR